MLVPPADGLELASGGENVKGRGAACGGDFEPSGVVAGAEFPGFGAVIALGGVVVVAMVDEDFDGEGEAIAGVAEFVLGVSGVFLGLHPDAFLEAGIGAGVGPSRGGAFEVEAFGVAVAVAGGGATTPAIAAQRIGFAQVVSGFVKLAEEEGSLQGWFEGGDEKSVVAAGEDAGEGAAAVATNAIGDQPFTLGGLNGVAANITTKRNASR